VNTQTERVLRLLERRGPHGVTAVDFQLPDIADGGKPILRVAARILELRDQGHRIVDGGVRNKCKVYILEPAQTEPEPVVEPDTGQLLLEAA
jgi:hypothetical protein